MKRFSLIVKAREKHLVSGLSKKEKKEIFQSLVYITLNYWITGNYLMYNHSIRP